VNRKITFGSFWLVTLAISFYWGFVARDPFDSIQRKVIEDTFIREMDGNDLDELMEEIAGIKTDRVETASSSLVTEETNEQAIELNFQHLDLEKAGQEVLTGDRIREVLSPALVSSDLVGRNAVIADMLARLTAENAGDALKVFENTASSYHTDNNYRLFLHAWAKVDGASALNYIMNNPNAHNVEGGQVWAMSGWTAADPRAAYDFVMGRDDVDYGLYHGLVRGWGRIDLDGAQEFVSSLENKKLKSRLANVVSETYIEKHGIQGAMDWASSKTNGYDKGFSEAAFKSVVGRAIPQSSNYVAEWISRNPDNKLIEPWMFEKTAGKLAQRDPGLAASWLESHLGNKKLNGQVVGEVASRWVKSDPEAAASWVDSLEGTRVYDKELARKLGGVWARSDPEAALNWADKLKPDLWRPTSASIVGNMPIKELREYAPIIKQSPEDGANDGLRAAYAMRMADDDPYDAIEQALMMKDTLGREKVTVYIAKKLFKKDPAGIKDWLPQSGLSTASQQRVLRGQ
jgi:hypothetical protein